MNPFKCRHCSRDAYWYFREGGMLCHGALHATAQMKDMLERSRLDKSVSDRAVSSGSTLGRVGAFSDAGLVARPESISPPSVLSPPEAGTPSEYPFPSLGSKSPPEAGALASHLLPVTAGAALSDKYATTFRVTADNSIQESM